MGLLATCAVLRSGDVGDAASIAEKLEAAKAKLAALLCSFMSVCDGVRRVELRAFQKSSVSAV